MQQKQDNYRLSRDRAQAYFLEFDQKTVINAWQLSWDEDWLYTEFLGRPYRICRKTGKVIRCWDGLGAEHAEVLSIFDLLCHEGTGKHLTGVFAPVNSLKGRPRAIGVGTDFHTGIAGRFDRDPEAFRCACAALGGKPVDMADISYRFPVFQDLTVILKFYHRDEEFPASLTLLWEENTLQYVFYETVFYIAGFLLEAITDEMEQCASHAHPV